MLGTNSERLPPLTGGKDEDFMREALAEALCAWREDEVPVGAVVVRGDEIIARGHNTREREQDPLGHAEIKAISEASGAIGSWRLEECTLYVTLEPCLMCAGAIVNSRIPRVIWGANDPKGGACVSLYEVLTDSRLNHRCEVEGGIYGELAGSWLTEYFSLKRGKSPK
jgi:tRNA(adenine34) deaminase